KARKAQERSCRWRARRLRCDRRLAVLLHLGRFIETKKRMLQRVNRNSHYAVLRFDDCVLLERIEHERQKRGFSIWTLLPDGLFEIGRGHVVKLDSHADVSRQRS